MTEGQVRTLVLAVLTVAAGIGLVVLAGIGTELAIETTKRIEGAFAILVPALLHSLTVMGRDDARERARDAIPVYALGSRVIVDQPDAAPLRGRVVAVTLAAGGAYVYTVDHGADDVREYHENEVRDAPEREPTGGHRV
jgi:hypothetical protein